MLLLFVIPLSFTLSGFLLWTMYALNGAFWSLICSPLLQCTFLSFDANQLIETTRYYRGIGEPKADIQTRDVQDVVQDLGHCGHRDCGFLCGFVDVFLESDG